MWRHYVPQSSVWSSPIICCMQLMVEGLYVLSVLEEEDTRKNALLEKFTKVAVDNSDHLQPGYDEWCIDSESGGLCFRDKFSWMFLHPCLSLLVVTGNRELKRVVTHISYVGMQPFFSLHSQTQLSTRYLKVFSRVSVYWKWLAGCQPNSTRCDKLSSHV